MRLLAAGLLALLAVAGACSSDGDESVEPSVVPAGSEAVVEDGFPLGVYGAGTASGSVAFGSYAEFHEDGTGRVRGLTPGLHDSRFTYVAYDDQIEVTATTGDCEVGAIGTYRWSVEVSALRLADPVDFCDHRWDVLHSDWYPLGDTPVVEVDPGGGPVTIDSPIGPIDWQFVAGQPYWGPAAPFQDSYRPVVAIEGGFVAVVDEQTDEADPGLVFSQNGIDWQPIPSPPSTVRFIAADGKKLYVSPLYPPEVAYVSADRGGTWTALEVEDPPAAIGDLYAGPAGVVLTGPGSTLWLLDGDSFEQVSGVPASFDEVLVLDTGFFAWSIDTNEPDRERKLYWRSGDGRTWTEAAGVPDDMADPKSWGQNLYLSNWLEDIGYTSTDGGRTWGDSTRRPGEGLAVTDAGYVSVQSAAGLRAGVVWVSSDDVDWQRVVNPWPPVWTHDPVISGDTILIPIGVEPLEDELGEHLDLVGHIN